MIVLQTSVTDAAAYSFTGAKSQDQNELVPVSRAQGLLQSLQSAMQFVAGTQYGHRDIFFSCASQAHTALLLNYFAFFFIWGKISGLLRG